MKEKILIVVELYANITRDDISNFQLLKTDYIDVLNFEDLSLNPNIINDYKAILDCTNTQSLISFVTNIGATKLIGKYNHFQINNQIFLPGTAIQHFMITKRELDFIPKELQEIKKETSLEITKKIDFLKTFIVIKHTYEDIDKGLENGLEYHTENGKRYVITKKIPDIQNENTEYITNTDIPIVKDILDILQYIKD